MSARLLVVSNRLPLVIERVDGRWRARSGSGGLVTALTPVLRRHGGLWAGWPGAVEEDEGNLAEVLAEAGAAAGFSFAPVWLTP